MAVIENSVLIDRSPEVVFDYLIDMRNERDWNPNLRLMEKITNGPIGVGTKFRAKWKQSRTLIVECTEFDRPRSWGYRNGGRVSVDLHLTIVPHGSGSLVTSRFDAHPHGWFRLFFPIFLVVMRRAERNDARSYKQALEAR